MTVTSKDAAPFFPKAVSCAISKNASKASSPPHHPPDTLVSNQNLPITTASITSQCRLTPCQLSRHSDPSQLPKTTDQAFAADIKFGQSRAVKAIQTALDIKAEGYHIFAAGENGLGKHTLILQLLTQIAAKQSSPKDWIYVYNFAQPRSPQALALPPGDAPTLGHNLEQLWLTISQRLKRHFGSSDYQRQIKAIKKQARIQTSKAFYSSTLKAQLTVLSGAFAQQKDTLAFKQISPKLTLPQIKPNLTPTPFIPKYLQDSLSRFQFASAIAEAQHRDMERHNRSIATQILSPLFQTLKTQFSHIPIVITYLESVMADMVTHIDLILAGDERFKAMPTYLAPARYCIDILITQTPNSGAPIVIEDHPTPANLLGQIEQPTQLDFSKTIPSVIQAGSLHRANGGYLILKASQLLSQPLAWQRLKQALQSKCIKLANHNNPSLTTGGFSLSPDSIDLDVKVVIIGELELYYELIDLDPEFSHVVKIRADFHDDIIRSKAAEYALVAKMAEIIHQAGLLPFDNKAQAKVLDYLSYQAEDQNKLSLHRGRLLQLLHESSRHARLRQSRTARFSTHLAAQPSTDTGSSITTPARRLVSDQDVENAIADMADRSSHLKELYWQELKEGQQLIATQGSAIGQINALTVISDAASEVEFGIPARLTALIQPNIGAGDILDIERDVELGGSLHAKGMLIMTSYLRALFSRHHTLNFSASLAFEQSYAHIDGDSATLSEACALFSALADVPIKQSLAITGSMNQLGEVQAVGGVNSKIAAFFDACQAQGLTGDQGVIIPAANASQLMLRGDIIQAAHESQFHIYAVVHLHEALALLTGIPIASKTKKGRYKKRSLFGKIIRRLRTWEKEAL